MIAAWRTVVLGMVVLGAASVRGEESSGGVEAPENSDGPAVVGGATPDAALSDGEATPVSSDHGGPPSDVDPKSFEEQIERALARLSSEPALPELERAALGHADVDIESTRRWRRTPRLSAMLPTLKVTGDYDVGRDETLDRYQERPDRWGADSDRGYGFQVSAQWHLNELVFNPDEIRAYDALTDRAGRREALLNLLIGYYFERRRLQLEAMLLPSASIGEMLDRRMRIRELTASIDALTGGLLSRKLYRGGTSSP